MRDERTDGRQNLCAEIILPEADADGLLDTEDDVEESDRVEADSPVEERSVVADEIPRRSVPA